MPPFQLKLKEQFHLKLELTLLFVPESCPGNNSGTTWWGTELTFECPNS
jgi:hypothetical protein